MFKKNNLSIFYMIDGFYRNGLKALYYIAQAGALGIYEHLSPPCKGKSA